MASHPLTINGGTPPPAADDDRPQGAGGPLREEAPPASLVQSPTPVEAPEEWSRETLKTIVALPFMAAHIVARRQGPPDAWMPGDEELDLMTGPLLGMANRYAVLRALSRFGDPVAFTAAVGTYTVAESRRIAAWRLRYAEELPIEEELDLGGIVTTAGGPPRTPERPPAASEGVRAWRPPAFDDGGAS